MFQGPQGLAINVTAADLHSTHDAYCCVLTDMPPGALHMGHPPRGDLEHLHHEAHDTWPSALSQQGKK